MLPASTPRIRLIFVASVFSVLAAGCFNPLPPGETASVSLLTSGTYTSLLIEIDYVGANKPHDDAIALLQQRANERLDKPGGVTIQVSQLSEASQTWSPAKLRAAESAHRDFSPDRQSGQMTLYVLYAEGGYSRDSGNGRVLGVHYNPSGIAVFKDNIKAGSYTGLFGVREVERSVLVHEFGHALGLVGCGLEMVKDHMDPQQECHSANRQSVMYWAVESNEIINQFLNPPPTQFDSDDMADIRAAGGK